MDDLTFNDANIDNVEAMLLDSDLEMVEMPLIHTLLPGLYVREIFMPKSTLLTSKIHKTEHPYVVLSGQVSVAIPGGETETFTAGHMGVTKEGTRRILYILEDCRWATYHVLSHAEEAARRSGAAESVILEMIEDRIIEKRILPDGRNTFEEYKNKLREQENSWLLQQ